MTRDTKGERFVVRGEIKINVDNFRLRMYKRFLLSFFSSP